MSNGAMKIAKLSGDKRAGCYAIFTENASHILKIEILKRKDFLKLIFIHIDNIILSNPPARLGNGKKLFVSAGH